MPVIQKPKKNYGEMFGRNIPVRLLVLVGLKLVNELESEITTLVRCVVFKGSLI